MAGDVRSQDEAPAGMGFDTGLDWESAGSLSVEERREMLDWYRRVHGEDDLRLVPFAAFMIDHLPVDFRRYRKHVAAIASVPDDEEGLPPAALGLLWVHLYMYLRDERGILYQVIASRRWGATWAEVMGTVAFGFLEAGPLGMNAVAGGAGGYLSQWAEESAQPSRWWPHSWTAKAASDEKRSADPRSLTTLHPAVAATYTERWTQATSWPLPAQLSPLLTLHLAAARGRVAAAVDAVSQARQTGAARHQVVQTLWWALLYGGQTASREIDEAVGDVLAAWS